MDRNAGTSKSQSEPEKLETEAEMHIKSLVKKQLSTTGSRDDILKQQLQFTKGVVHKTATETLSGERSLSNYDAVAKQDDQIEMLKQCGLTDDEISFKLGIKGGKRRRYGINPEIEENMLQDIDKKIQSRQDDISNQEPSIHVKEISRHRLDFERKMVSKYDIGKSTFLNSLTKSSKSHDLDSKHPMNNLNKIFKNRKRSYERKGQRVDYSNIVAEEEDIGRDVEGPLIPVSHDQIITNKLGLDEIRALPRFTDYEPGEPSCVLYLKNLSSKVTECDLVPLFSRFEDNSKVEISYKLLKGRMRGQAFITFNSIQSATSALEFVNGYRLYNQPMIIQYGKKSK